MGQLVFQANSGGQTNLVGQNTASTFNLNIPLANGTLVSTGDTATVTSTMISGPVTTAKGGTGLTSFTANGVVYASSTSALTTGSALTFDGTNFTVTQSAWQFYVGANFAKVQNTTGTSASLVLADSTDSATIKNIGSSIAFINSSSEKMRLTSTGLGIGTTNPSQLLSLGSTSGTRGQLYVTAPSGSSPTVQLDGTGTSGGHAYILYSNGSAAGNFDIYDATSSAFRLTLDSNGNLGLGVTPSAWGSGGNLQLAGTAVVGFKSDGGNYYSNAYYNGGFKYASNGYAEGYVQYLGQHQWYIAPSGTAGNAISFTQAMTLDNNGNLLVGQTSYSQTSVGCSLVGNGGIACAQTSSSSAQASYTLYSTGAGAYRFYVDLAGTIHATSIVITAISDQRLKENVRDIDTGLDAIMALKPRRFDWKEGKGQNKKNAAGFIAQEFGEVFPESLSTFKAGEDDPTEYLTMNHEELIPSLVKAIQELKAEFDAYKASHP